MTILAIDIGQKTGWAYQRDGMPPQYGVERFQRTRHEGAGMIYVRFQAWLIEMVNCVEPTRVYYEEVAFHGKNNQVATAHTYGGFMAHIQTVCEKHQIPYGAIPVGTVKKLWTGKGNAAKPAMIAEAKRRGFAPEDDNAADALAILHAAQQ